MVSIRSAVATKICGLLTVQQAEGVSQYVLEGMRALLGQGRQLRKLWLGIKNDYDKIKFSNCCFKIEAQSTKWEYQKLRQQEAEQLQPSTSQ